MSDLPNTAVIGPGAVGCFFGGMLARAGARVTLFGRPESESPHREAIREHGLAIDGVELQETIPLQVAEVGTDEGDAALAAAELVLFAVKSQDTLEAGEQMRGRLHPEAIVVSLQNGIDNPEVLAELGIDALPTVVFVAAAIEQPGVVKHRGRGDLIIGDPDRRAGAPGDAAKLAAAERVSEWFETAGVPCPVADDIRRGQWLKLILNSMTNGISALTDASYRALVEFEPTWELALGIGREAVAVAKVEGTVLDLDEIVAMGRKIAGGIGEATSSTQQDIAAGRTTEIDSLNGYIVRRGAELGVETPINRA
ncbi:MAG: 2-dehydropantoate 2-reductase, partial [Thermoanaerobaculia bacterium]|nr:2-dehydropantoate 2-reductase [Thermoanaerobaculia bacterium]